MPAPAFPPPEAPTLPIAGEEARFPVRRVWCVGQNYADHVREMGGDADRDAPIFFAKSAHSVATTGSGPARIPYPTATSDFHYEAELVLAIGPRAEVFGCAVGLDMTRRDLQSAAKSRGQPWSTAKELDASAPVGPITRDPPPGPEAAIALTVNGDIRQSATLGQMIWSPEQILGHLARYITLAPGDLVFTGTPSGVGPVTPGDQITARIDGLDPLTAEILAPRTGA